MSLNTWPVILTVCLLGCVAEKPYDHEDPMQGVVGTTKFYYSRELGVTSFYTTGNPAAVGLDAKMLSDGIPLLTYVLFAQKGFLRAPLALPRMTSGPNCHN